MKRSLLLMLLTFLLAISISSSAQEVSYLTYHQEIINAEKYISNENYVKALETYQNIFQKYEFVFLRDYKNATQIAYFLNDEATTFTLLKEGIKAGWTLKSIQKNNFLSPFQHTEKWSQIKKDYPIIRETYLNNLNEKVRAQVHQMSKKDQKKALAVFVRIGDKAQERYATKKFAPHSELQLQEFIQIDDQYGYPGEQLIGNDDWMEMILSHHNSISDEYTQKDTLYNFIKPKLFVALDKGQISPYELAMIDDWYIAVHYDRQLAGYGFLDAPQNKTIDKTNALRKKVGLRSVELRNKLIDIEKETGMNLNLPDWVKGKIEILSTDNELIK